MACTTKCNSYSRRVAGRFRPRFCVCRFVYYRTMSYYTMSYYIMSYCTLFYCTTSVRFVMCVGVVLPVPVAVTITV